MKEIISQPLREQVFDRIKEKIRTGALKQGDLLPGENKLAEMLGVSRVTVRWALKQLSEVGIIETRKGKGSVVVVDWKSLLDGESHAQAKEYQKTFFMSTKARRLIEPKVAWQAAQSATEEDLARMETALYHKDEELVLYPILGQTSKLVDFHTSIWLSLHNPILMETWKLLADTSEVIKRLPFVQPTQREEQREAAQRQHQRIFEAIRDRDAEYAYFYMLRHFDWLEETYGQYFEDYLQ